MPVVYRTGQLQQEAFVAMARYIVSYRISRYWDRIVAYLYRDNYPSNEVDISHNSQSPSASKPSMPSATSTKGVSCSVAGAGKVTLIGSNSPASRVGRCVDCEGGQTAQVFSDCAITKYLSRATARLTEALLNNPGLQGTPATRPPAAGRLAGRPWPSPRRSASIQAPAAATVLIGRTTVLQCCALLPACLRFLHMVKHFRIVSYRIAIFCVISYRIESCPLWLYRAITKHLCFFYYHRVGTWCSNKYSLIFYFLLMWNGGIKR